MFSRPTLFRVDVVPVAVAPFDPPRSPLPRKSSLSSLISQGFQAFRGEIVSTTKGLRAKSISSARAKRQITINDEVASQLRPFRAINLRTVVCSMLLLSSHPPLTGLVCSSACATGRESARKAPRSYEMFSNYVRRVNHSNQVDKFVLSCLIIRVN